MRFISGWVTKIPYMTPLLVNNIGLLVAGVVTLLVPVCATHGLLIAYCVIWGGFIGEDRIGENVVLDLALFCSVSCRTEPSHRF